jgi:hypothetical protein
MKADERMAQTSGLDSKRRMELKVSLSILVQTMNAKEDTL